MTPAANERSSQHQFCNCYIRPFMVILFLLK